MRTQTVKIRVYRFDELDADARQRAINDLIEFFSHYDYDFIRKSWPKMADAIDKAEQMQTPWFTGQYIYDYCYNDLLLPCLQEQEFEKDGKYWGEIGEEEVRDSA